MKRHFFTIALVTLAFASLSWAQIDTLAIFNENVGWTSVEVAQAATDFIVNNVSSANEIVILNDADMGAFAEENTGDGNFDIILTFGYFPISLYTPGNSQADDSVGEKFLEGGDMLLNTADYIFYVTEGGGANGDTGLKNMTDSNFDCWTDGNTCSATDAGSQYTPSLPEFTAPRSFKKDQIDEDPDWEVEVAFGSNADGTMLDPVIIRNLTYGGRVGGFFHVSDDALPRGEVCTEMIDNYLALNVTAVEPTDKIASTWGQIKK